MLLDGVERDRVAAKIERLGRALRPPKRVAQAPADG
jgi:hypothetical protein